MCAWAMVGKVSLSQGMPLITGAKLATNMRRIDDRAYETDLSSPQTAYIEQSRAKAQSAPTRYYTLFSWTALINFFFLWLLVSMAQQIHRLRDEVAFVKDETRDMRLYSLAHADATRTTAWMTESSPTETNAIGMAPQEDLGQSVGRVLFGPSIWSRFVGHPTCV